MKKKKKKDRKSDNKVHSSYIVTETISEVKIPKWQYYIPPILLSIIAAIFYAPSMRYAFQFDDIPNITKHFNIRHNTLSKLFFSGTRWISYWLNSIHYAIGRFDPFSYRIGNLLIHITTGTLVFFIILTALSHLRKKSFFRDNAFPIAFLTSIAFLLHPVQTQTVSYVIQGQLEGLAALAILSMVFLFLKLSYAKTSFTRHLATIFLFVVAALSCGTKEIAIISPALLLLADWFFVAQGEWSSLKKRLYIHIPLALLVFAVYIYFLKPTFFTEILGLQRIAKNNIGNIITQAPTDKITPWMFFRSQFKVILHYLWIFIWPFNISVEYDWVLSKSFFSIDCILPFLFLITIALAIVKILKTNKASLVAFGALWFFVSIAPRSSIIPSPELLVDYKTYTASFGWLFLLASACIYLLQYSREKIKVITNLSGNHVHYKIACSLLLAITFGFLTIQRNTIWRSGLEFWGNMIQNAPGKARAYNNYGVEMSQKLRDYKGSIAYFKKAINMDKQYSDPWNNLAVAYANTKQLDKAIHALKQSLKICPYYPEGYNNLASFYLQKNNFAESERLLQIAIRLRPHYGKAHFNLGRVYFAKGEKEKSLHYFKKSCTECDFDNVPYGFATYGKVCLILKKYDECIVAYKKALSFDPNYPNAEFNLANAYYMKKDYDQAIKLYKNALSKNPNNLNVWNNLGETYFLTKQYAQALGCYKKAAHLKDQILGLRMRMAHCLDHLGKPQEAKQLLQELVTLENKNNNPQLVNIQNQAKGIINQLNKKHDLST